MIHDISAGENFIKIEPLDIADRDKTTEPWSYSCMYIILPTSVQSD